MNDQENIREIIERSRLKTPEQKEEEIEKVERLHKEHLERLAVLHRRARGEKW
jgi:hypothetical protein